MKASELRIGNKIKFMDDGTIFTVVSIDLKGAGLENISEFAWIEFESLEPIPLTEEWLLKFGFKQNLDKWFEINYFTDCTLSAEKMGILINLCSNRCAILDTDTDQQSAMTAKRIYYLHQLQNLFFSLTGEELTLTES